MNWLLELRTKAVIFGRNRTHPMEWLPRCVTRVIESTVQQRRSTAPGLESVISIAAASAGDQSEGQQGREKSRLAHFIIRCIDWCIS